MRLIAAAAVCALSFGLAPSPNLFADIGTTTDEISGTVTVVARSAPVYSVGGGGGGAQCSWTPMFFTRDPAADPFTAGEVLFGLDSSFPAAIREIGGAASRLYLVSCPGVGSTQRWVALGTSSADLVAGLIDIVEAQLQPPVPDINPAPGDGGIVNLGMWLAVEPQSLQPVTAEAGFAWMTVTPQLSTTEFDLGNDDRVTCDGVGVPIEDVHPDLDVIEPSPTCGYTYRTSSPDEAPYQLTISAVWDLPYTSSDGAGQLPALRRSVTVDYDVDEIQTIGTSN